MLLFYLESFSILSLPTFSLSSRLCPMLRFNQTSNEFPSLIRYNVILMDLCFLSRAFDSISFPSPPNLHEWSRQQPSTIIGYLLQLACADWASPALLLYCFSFSCHQDMINHFPWPASLLLHVINLPWIGGVMEGVPLQFLLHRVPDVCMSAAVVLALDHSAWHGPSVCLGYPHLFRGTFSQRTVIFIWQTLPQEPRQPFWLLLGRRSQARLVPSRAGSNTVLRSRN